jgi:hypothetical protein
MFCLMNFGGVGSLGPLRPTTSGPLKRKVTHSIVSGAETFQPLG